MIYDDYMTNPLLLNNKGTAWALNNGGGSILGKPGSALGTPGSALGGNTGMFGGQLTGAGRGAPNYSLSGVKGPEQLDFKSGKEGGPKMSGTDIASMGFSSGLPQALLGSKVGNTVSQAGSGAMTGMTMGGPVGAAVGGGLGLMGGLSQGKQGDNKRMQAPPIDPNAFYL